MLLGDGLELLLLGHQLVLQPVHFLLQLQHRLLSELSTGLSLLQLGSQRLDLLLVGLLPVVGLLLSNLKGLQVVSNNPQLLLQLQNLGLSNISTLLSLLKVRLTGCQLLSNLVIGGISSFSLLTGLLQVLLQECYPLLILIGLALENLLGTLRVISGGSSLVQLGNGSNHLLLSLLKILLKSGNTPGESVHLKLGGGKLLLLLLQLEGGNAQPLSGDIELSLELPGLDQELLNLILTLLGADPGRLHLLLADIRLVAGIVLLHLHGLHLLLDGLHLGAGGAVEEDVSRRRF